MAVMGPSGSGKSTLPQCAAGLDRPDSGEVTLCGMPLSRLREAELTRLRREQVGFVFRSSNLLPSLTAAQNVELPLRLGGPPHKAGASDGRPRGSDGSAHSKVAFTAPAQMDQIGAAAVTASGI